MDGSSAESLSQRLLRKRKVKLVPAASDRFQPLPHLHDDVCGTLFDRSPSKRNANSLIVAACVRSGAPVSDISSFHLRKAAYASARAQRAAGWSGGPLFKGPMTKKDKVKWDKIRYHSQEARTYVVELKSLLIDEPDHPERQIMEDEIRHSEKVLAMISKALDWAYGLPEHLVRSTAGEPSKR
jgi:hypothetical protein